MTDKLCALIDTVEYKRLPESSERQLYIPSLYPLLIMCLVMKHHVCTFDKKPKSL